MFSFLPSDMKEREKKEDVEAEKRGNGSLWAPLKAVLTAIKIDFELQYKQRETAAVVLTNITVISKRYRLRCCHGDL